MLEYVNIQNIDDRILAQGARILQEGGLVAWPSDTSWSICCSLDSPKGIARLKTLKGTGSFVPTVVCSEIRQFDDLVLFSTPHYRLVKSLSPGPYVFVLEARHGVHKKINMKRSELGLRLPEHPVPQGLVAAHGQPVFAITASRQMSEPGWWDQAFAEEHLFEYGAELEEIPGIDLIIDTGEVLERHLATVVSLIGGEPEILRQGIGRI